MPGGLHEHAGDRDTEMPSLLAGRTTIGTAATDIILQGPGLVSQHCYIENVQGTLTLHPCGNACTIDGVPLQRPTHLTQGRNRLWFTGAFARGVVPLSIGVFVTAYPIWHTPGLCALRWEPARSWHSLRAGFAACIK